MNERFWKFVVVTGPEECWNWSGALSGGRDGKSYGVFARPRREGGQRMVYAHRMSYCLEHGIDITTLPRTTVIRHRCDNGRCCNPAHLQSGTQADNAKDMAQRGRSTRGVAAPGAVLDEKSVKLIRQQLESGGLHRIIAEAFGVHRATISQIARGANWAWVE